MKAVLVIDMPTDCPECPMAHWNKLDEFTGCEAVSGKKYAINDKEYAESSCRPSWCPLRPLPKKFNEGIEYDMDGFGFDKYLETGFKMGWDAYYDKITKNHIGENTEKVCNDDLYENWMFFDKGETE